MEHVFCRLLEVVIASEFGEWDFLRKKIDLEHVPFSHGVFEIALPTAIVLEGWANVPTNLAATILVPCGASGVLLKLKFP